MSREEVKEGLGGRVEAAGSLVEREAGLEERTEKVVEGGVREMEEDLAATEDSKVGLKAEEE